MTTVPVLSVKDVRVTFGGLTAVDDLTFEVEEGQLFGVIGPNGAGKTTILNAVSGVVPIRGGEIKLRDQVISRLRPYRVAHHRIARTFQGADFFSEFSVLDSLMLGRWGFSNKSMGSAMFRLPAARRSEAREKGLVMDQLERVDLTEIAQVSLKELPYGTRKVLDVLRALLMEPTLLLLDEPTSGTTSADREQLATLIRGIKEQGIATVLVDHDVRFTSNASDLIMAVNFGSKLGIDTPKKLLERPDVRAAYVGME